MPVSLPLSYHHRLKVQKQSLHNVVHLRYVFLMGPEGQKEDPVRYHSSGVFWVQFRWDRRSERPPSPTGTEGRGVTRDGPTVLQRETRDVNLKDPLRHESFVPSDGRPGITRRTYAPENLLTRKRVARNRVNHGKVSLRRFSVKNLPPYRGSSYSSCTLQGFGTHEQSLNLSLLFTIDPCLPGVPLLRNFE